MIRHRDGRELFLVTRIAIARQAFILFVHMALCTLRCTVCTLQRVVRLRMIEGGGFPEGGGVTCETVGGELSLDMVRCRQCGDIFLMTRKTFL